MNTKHTPKQNTSTSTISPNKGLCSESGKSKLTEPVSAPPPAPSWRGVFFHGPQPEPDRRDGEEIPVWTVYVGNDEDNAIGPVYRVFSFAKAQALATAMSTDRRLELVAEAMPA